MEFLAVPPRPREPSTALAQFDIDVAAREEAAAKKRKKRKKRPR